MLPPILTYALSAVASVKYPLLVVGAFVEGPILMVASGFLLHLKVFEPVPLYFCLLLGDLLADIGWYFIGYYFADPFLLRYGRFFGLTVELFEKSKKVFNRYQEKILFISKITMGFGLAIGTLMAAGASRVPFVRYMVLNILGELVFVTIMLSVGYFFGGLYNYIADGFKTLSLVGIVLVSVLGIYGLANYFRSKILG